jgi:hypothetical protein
MHRNEAHVSNIKNEPEIINEVVHDRGMKTIIKLEQLFNIGDIKRFLNGTDIVVFNVVTTKQDVICESIKLLKSTVSKAQQTRERHSGSVFDESHWLFQASD